MVLHRAPKKNNEFMNMQSANFDDESTQVARLTDTALESITGHRCAFAVVWTRPDTPAVAGFSVRRENVRSLSGR